MMFNNFVIYKSLYYIKKYFILRLHLWPELRELIDNKITKGFQLLILYGTFGIEDTENDGFEQCGCWLSEQVFMLFENLEVVN